MSEEQFLKRIIGWAETGMERGMPGDDPHCCLETIKLLSEERLAEIREGE